MLIQAIFYNNPDHYPPMINGAFVLAQHGIRQQIICRQYQSKVMPQGQVNYPSETRVVRLPVASGGSLIAYLIFIWNVLRKSEPEMDIVIGYDMHGFLPARLLAWLRRRPLVYHCHDYLNNAGASTLAQRIIKTFERLFARTADLVIVPDSGRAVFMADELSLRQPPMVIANAARIFHSRNRSLLVETLQKHEIQLDRVVLRQGRIGPGHAIEVTIRSMPYWKSDDWGFVLIGPVEPDYAGFLVSLAEDYDVASRFAILPAVSYPEVSQYTAGANLGHALYEPIHINNRHITTASNKILEYIAAGIPLLLSNSSGSDNLLSRYQVGLTADVDSPESIAEAVNTILGDDALARQMGERSRQAFENEYNYAHQYAPVIARLRELVGSREKVISHREVGHRNR